MISIKKYLDQTNDRKKSVAGSDETLAAALNAYRATLEAMAENAVRACPSSSSDLHTALKQIAEMTAAAPTPESLNESGAGAEKQLQLWSTATTQHLKQKVDEVRELLLVLAKTGEEAYERDQRYAGKFNEITQQLNSIANLDDIAQIRGVVMRSAAALKSSTTKMTEDGAESMTRLKAQLTTYQSRLEEAERVASRDSLTGLRSRLNVEEQIERRLEQKKLFSLLMVDLNGFKQVNDTYGHGAGDDLLKQFAAELSSVSRSTDIVGRWGGDEFLVIVDGPLDEAKLRAQRLKDWACGEYTLDLQEQKVKVQLGASIGVVETAPGETAVDAVKRADADMYQDKKSNKAAK
jgi:diguanylate cyclase (GGDEF)-like protein